MCYAANNILLMRKCIYALVWKAVDCFPELSWSDLNMKTKLGDRMTRQLLNSVITKNRDLSQCPVDQLFATDKSRYFPQPRPIIIFTFHGHFAPFHVGLVFQTNGMKNWDHCNYTALLTVHSNTEYQNNRDKLFHYTMSFLLFLFSVTARSSPQ